VIDGGAGRLTVIANACVAVCTGLLPSFTCTVKLIVPVGPVAVPETNPALLIVNPAGKLPTLTLYARGANPVAAICWLYATPSVAPGKLVVVIAGAAGKFTRMLNACVADCAPAVLASVIFTVKFAVPFGPVGVPLIFPVPSIASPAGNVPALIENVQVPAPPLQPTVWLYAVPSATAGNVVVVIDGIAVTVTFTVAVFVLSFTDVAVTTAVPACPFALYVTDVVVGFVSAPGPLVNVHVTPPLLESCATAAVRFTVCPWSSACADPGDTLTATGADPPEHPAITTKLANTHAIQMLPRTLPPSFPKTLLMLVSFYLLGLQRLSATGGVQT